MKFFSVFTETNYTFEGQHSYETVVALLYRHWFVIFSRLFGFFLLAFVPVLVYFFAWDWITLYELQGVYGLFVIVYLLAWWFQMFYAITMYLLDTWILTDHRVVDSEQHGFFNRTVAELNLSKIQDISISVGSFIGTMLKFGNLEIQTAGTHPKFEFKQIPNPQEVENQLTIAHNEYMSKHPGGVEDDIG